MADSRGMGRGLAAILSASPREVTAITEAASVDGLRSVPVVDIVPNPHQPRRAFDDADLAALADSLRERGVLQPVIVRPLAPGRFQLIAGERRWRAARLAEIDEIPALVRHEDDRASLELALIENMAREDLNPVEEARACAALVEDLGLTREEVGRRVGRSRVAVSNLIRLLDLPDEALALIEAGSLSEGHGRALLLTADHGHRRRLARSAADRGWSVRELERRARSAGSRGEARPRHGPASVHPDRAAALDQVAEALGAALGTAVDVQPQGQGCRAQLSFESLEDARAFAARLDRAGS